MRHWKLHEARGFWKMHPQKEDLVYALLEYMEDKEEYNRKGPTRCLMVAIRSHTGPPDASF